MYKKHRKISGMFGGEFFYFIICFILYYFILYYFLFYYMLSLVIVYKFGNNGKVFKGSQK